MSVLRFPFAPAKDTENPERGSVATFDHESTHLDFRASLTLVQLEQLIAALQDQQRQLQDWDNGYLFF